MRRAVFGGFLISSLSACQTTMAKAPQDALLSNPSPKVLTEISETISGALSGRKTLLSKDVLTKNPELIIDPKYVDGRSLQRPDHFKLQITGTDCQLLHVETGKIYPLKKTRCTPV